ncbi:MAG: DUF262 domain-containing protein [Firmicutes bacterium]|nr:DUF262 domain-containing protein [Bacillota bacterium]
MDIIGTTKTVEEFFENKQFEINAKSKHTFQKNRRYVVPDYQREIRWECQNLESLMNDILRGEKFLGNLILQFDECQNTYDIIDGQQRLTSFCLLFKFFESNDRYSKKIDACELQVESFTTFQECLTWGFDKENEPVKELTKQDNYAQCDRYRELYECIQQFFKDKDMAVQAGFCKNLWNSSINMIVSTDSKKDSAMEYYLDVNVKALPLDAEDVYKGYFFQQSDNRVDTKKQWVALKEEYHKFEKKIKETIRKKNPYLLAIMLEQCIKCTLHLHKNEEYKKIEIDSKLCLAKELKSNELGNSHKGEHLLKAIINKDYNSQCVRVLTEYLRFVNHILCSSAPNDFFKEYFVVDEKEDKISDDCFAIYYFQLRSLLRSSAVVPKAFVLKYFLTILLDKKPKPKAKYENLNIVYLLGTTFLLFEAGRKNIKDFEKILGAEESVWHSSALEEFKRYFKQDFEESKLLKKYMVKSAENADNQYLAKSFASIYNYYTLGQDKVSIKNCKELVKFYTEKDSHSIEHFLLNNSNKVTHHSLSAEYPKEIQGVKNSIFNFIFIPKTINNDLANLCVEDKLEKLESLQSQCDEYTEMYLSVLIKMIDKKPYMSCREGQNWSQKEYGDKVQDFYAEHSGSFIPAFRDFVDKLVEEFKNKVFPDENQKERGTKK